MNSVLYNTLETVNFIAYDLCAGNNDISKTVTNLSQILRISLDHEHKIIPLKKEIEYLELYLNIIKLRMPTDVIL